MTSIMVAALLVAAEPPEVFRAVLVGPGIDPQSGWHATAHEITPECPVPWRVRRVMLHGGKQEGVVLVVIDNGAMKITVVPTRGMGILRVEAGDVRLGWDSPVKEVVHPVYVDLGSRGGLGWIEGFNEWLCRCGLESNGQPGPDRFINNLGEESTMELTLHGRIANLPAQQVVLEVQRAAPYRITLRGQVDERMLFGPKLELQSELSLEPGSLAMRLTDQVTNRGGQPQEFELLYHVNFGGPLLEAETRLAAPAAVVRPFNARAAEGLQTWAEYAGPTPGYIEQVYFLELRGDAQRRTQVVLHNRGADRGAKLAWSLDELPYFTLWKNTGAEVDGYVTGLEPGTNYPQHRSVERRHGRVPQLQPGEQRRFTLECEVLPSSEAVQQALAAVAALQGGQPAELDPRPVQEPADEEAAGQSTAEPDAIGRAPRGELQLGRGEPRRSCPLPAEQAQP